MTSGLPGGRLFAARRLLMVPSTRSGASGRRGNNFDCIPTRSVIVATAAGSRSTALCASELGNQRLPIVYGSVYGRARGGGGAS